MFVSREISYGVRVGETRFGFFFIWEEVKFLGKGKVGMWVGFWGVDFRREDVEINGVLE